MSPQPFDGPPDFLKFVADMEADQERQRAEYDRACLEAVARDGPVARALPIVHKMLEALEGIVEAALPDDGDARAVVQVLLMQRLQNQWRSWVRTMSAAHYREQKRTEHTQN